MLTISECQLCKILYVKYVSGKLAMLCKIYKEQIVFLFKQYRHGFLNLYCWINENRDKKMISWLLVTIIQ